MIFSEGKDKNTHMNLIPIVVIISCMFMNNCFVGYTSILVRVLNGKTRENVLMLSEPFPTF